MCLRFVRIGYQCLVIFFHSIITTNTQLIVFIILTVKGRGNFLKIKGGREQKSLRSSA